MTVKIKIPGTFLIDHSKTRAEYHEQKARFYGETAKSIQAEHREEFDGVSNVSRANPAEAALHKTTEHQLRGVWFRLQERFLEGDDKYEIDNSDITQFELQEADLS